MAHEHIVYMMLTDSAAQASDPIAIRRYVPQLQALAERDGHQSYLAVAHRAWGVVHRLEGDYTEAEGRLSQALAVFEERGALWQIGRTLYEMAKLDLARSDLDAAFDHFSRAQAEFEAVGAKPDVERTRTAFETKSFAASS